MRIWSWEQRKISTTQPFQGELLAIAIGASGLLAVITEDEKESSVLVLGRVVGNHFESLQTKPLSYLDRSPTSSAPQLAFSLNGESLAVATGAQVRILKTSSLREIASFELSGEVDAVALSPAGEYLAVATGARTTILKVSTKKPLSVVEDDHPVHAIAFSKDRRFLATASGPDSSPLIELPDDNIVRIWVLAPHELFDEADRRLSRLR